jgi:hypothetical protein
MKRILVIGGVVTALTGAVAGLLALLARRRQAYGDEASDTFDVVAVGVGKRVESGAARFAGGNVLVMCGALQIDLTRARLDTMGGYLEIDCWFGKTDVLVPPGWRVIVDRGVNLGRVENQARAWEDGGPAVAVLEIETRVVAGQVTIRAGEGARPEPAPAAWAGVQPATG